VNTFALSAAEHAVGVKPDDDDSLDRLFRSAGAICVEYVKRAHQARLPSIRCPGCAARELESTDRVALAMLKVIRSANARTRRERATRLRAVVPDLGL